MEDRCAGDCGAVGVFGSAACCGIEVWFPAKKRGTQNTVSATARKDRHRGTEVRREEGRPLPAKSGAGRRRRYDGKNDRKKDLRTNLRLTCAATIGLGGALHR